MRLFFFLLFFLLFYGTVTSFAHHCIRVKVHLIFLTLLHHMYSRLPLRRTQRDLENLTYQMFALTEVH